MDSRKEKEKIKSVLCDVIDEMDYSSSSSVDNKQMAKDFKDFLKSKGFKEAGMYRNLWSI